MIPSRNCFLLNSAFEGCRLHAYLDSANLVTIGYGNRQYANGNQVVMGDTITPQQAEDLHMITLTRFAGYVNTWFKLILSQQQFDALTDLWYNAGPGNAEKSRLAGLIRVNPGATEIIAAAWQDTFIHDHAGNLEPGLVRRRKAESWLYTTGEVKLIFP